MQTEETMPKDDILEKIASGTREANSIIDALAKGANEDQLLIVYALRCTIRYVELIFNKMVEEMAEWPGDYDMRAMAYFSGAPAIQFLNDQIEEFCDKYDDLA